MNEPHSGDFAITPPMVNNVRPRTAYYRVPVTDKTMRMDLALPDSRLLSAEWEVRAFELRDGRVFRDVILKTMGFIQSPIIAVEARFPFNNTVPGMECDLVYNNKVYGLAQTPQNNLQVIVLPDCTTLRATAWQILPTLPGQNRHRRAPMAPRVGPIINAEERSPVDHTSTWRLGVSA
jgi:hypothetical protein